MAKAVPTRDGTDTTASPAIPVPAPLSHDTGHAVPTPIPSQLELSGREEDSLSTPVLAPDSDRVPDGAQDNVADPPAAEPEAGRTKLETTLIIISLCSAMFLAALDVTIVTVAIPTISDEFHSTVGYTWIGSAYLLANAAAAPSWGKISDIWGRKQLLLVAVGVFWIGSLLCAVSVSMAMLIAARAIQGIGGGGIVILVNVSISDLFSMRKRGTYFGIMGMVWAIAGGLGPIIGGAFTARVSWRWCFYVNLPVSGAGFALLVFVLKLHNPRTGMRAGLAAVDWLGSLTIVGGTLMILLGLTFGGVAYPWKSPTVICLIIFGAVVIGIFTVVETRWARYPVIPMRLFHKRVALAAFGCCFVHGFVFISGSYYLPLYFQAVLGASPLLSGVYVLPFSITISASSTLAGILIRKTGKYVLLIHTGFVFLVIGFALFTNLGSKANWPKIVLYQMIASFGIGLNFQSPLIALQTTVEQRDIASATATFGFIRQLATSISVVVGGVVFQNGMQKQYGTLVAKIGKEAADLLSGGSAAANVYQVDKFDPASLKVARAAYWNSLQTMYILFASFAGLGCIVACFVTQNTLSKEHVEHKTGLTSLRHARESEKTTAAADTRNAVVEREAS